MSTANPLRGRASGPAAPAPRSRGAAPGFSITELVVVMAIITILSSLILSGVMAVRRRGGSTKTHALIVRIGLAVEQYQDFWGDYPAGSGGAASAELLREALASRKWPGSVELGEDDVRDTDGNGRGEIVDHWGRPLGYYHHRSYSGPPRERSFRLVSAGPDGREDTRDDVTNY